MATATEVDPARKNKKPRPLQDGERARLEEYIDSIGYSARYDSVVRCWSKTNELRDIQTPNMNTGMCSYQRPC